MTREEQSIEEAKNRFLDDQIYPASKVYVFVEGVKWADETMIKKACEWLDSALRPVHRYDETVDIVESFRKAMEK